MDLAKTISSADYDCVLRSCGWMVVCDEVSGGCIFSDE